MNEEITGNKKRAFQAKRMAEEGMKMLHMCSLLAILYLFCDNFPYNCLQAWCCKNSPCFYFFSVSIFENLKYIKIVGGLPITNEQKLLKEVCLF